jgi:hypothetical protein
MNDDTEQSGEQLPHIGPDPLPVAAMATPDGPSLARRPRRVRLGRGVDRWSVAANAGVWIFLAVVFARSGLEEHLFASRAHDVAGHVSNKVAHEVTRKNGEHEIQRDIHVAYVVDGVAGVYDDNDVDLTTFTQMQAGDVYRLKAAVVFDEPRAVPASRDVDPWALLFFPPAIIAALMLLSSLAPAVRVLARFWLVRRGARGTATIVEAVSSSRGVRRVTWEYDDGSGGDGVRSTMWTSEKTWLSAGLSPGALATVVFHPRFPRHLSTIVELGPFAIEE